MNFKVLIIIITTIIILTLLSYGLYFGVYLSYPLSKNPEAWTQLAGFFGGVLAPILSFFSIVLLINSLNMQNKANNLLIIEAERNKQSELIRQFESKFFHLIDSQKIGFANFELLFLENGKGVLKRSSLAISHFEDIWDEISELDGQDDLKMKLLQELDDDDAIYSIVRVFYIIVKITSDTFPDDSVEHKKLRKEYIITLINFTDITLMKLILIVMKYLTYFSGEYLKNNKDFMEVIEEVGLGEYYTEI